MGSTKDQLKAELQLICASAIGLKDFKVFIGHEHGNWGPEKPGSSFRENQIGPDLHKGMLAYDIDTQTFWFLAAPTNTCKVVALGQWNQNSIWIPDT